MVFISDRSKALLLECQPVDVQGVMEPGLQDRVPDLAAESWLGSRVCSSLKISPVHLVVIVEETQHFCRGEA